MSRDKRRNIAHTRHPSAVIKCRVMIDEPLLVICCFKVPPRRRVRLSFRPFSSKTEFQIRGREKKEERREGRNLGEIRESSFIIASGRIKLDGYGKEVNLFTPLGQFHVQLAGKPFSGRV